MFTLGLVTKCLFTLPIEAVSLAPNLMTGEWGIIFLVFRKLLMLPAYSLSLRGSVSVKINPTYEDTCVSEFIVRNSFFLRSCISQNKFCPAPNLHDRKARDYISLFQKISNASYIFLRSQNEQASSVSK